MRKSLVILLILLCCISFDLQAKKNKAELLQTNLKQWEQFRWEGIIQVQSSYLSLRKDFVLVKNKDEMRLDILDTGPMGLSAQPLVSAYLKDQIVLEAPTIKQLSNLDLNWFIPTGAVGSLIHFTDSLTAKSDEILKTRQAETAETVFSFDKDYRLVNISNPDLVLQAFIIYNRRNQPSKMQIKHAGVQVAELQINKQNYDNIVIVPLHNGLQETLPPAKPEISPPHKTGSQPKPLGDLKLSELFKNFDFSQLNLDEKELQELKSSLFGSDSLDWGNLTLKDILDSLNLGDLKLKELIPDSLQFFSPQLDSLDWQNLQQDLKKLMQDLNLQDLKSEDFDWNKLKEYGKNWEELLKGIIPSDLGLEKKQSVSPSQGL